MSRRASPDPAQSEVDRGYMARCLELADAYRGLLRVVPGHELHGEGW